MKMELIACMGSDDMVADCARISMAKLASNYTAEQNNKLIKYLVKHNHWSPLAHPQVQMRVTMPLFIARQYFKHIQGSVKNEISKRYVSDDPEFYMPMWRQAPEKSIKQGSGDPFDLETQHVIDQDVWEFYETAEELYTKLLRMGVAAEQARVVLPQSTITQIVDTGSLYYWSRMYKQRTDLHAQKEWAELMTPLNDIMGKLFPVSWPALTAGLT